MQLEFFKSDLNQSHLKLSMYLTGVVFDTIILKQIRFYDLTAQDQALIDGLDLDDVFLNVTQTSDYLLDRLSMEGAQKMVSFNWFN